MLKITRNPDITSLREIIDSILSGSQSLLRLRLGLLSIRLIQSVAALRSFFLFGLLAGGGETLSESWKFTPGIFGAAQSLHQVVQRDLVGRVVADRFPTLFDGLIDLA